jgi:hypothetical protein
MAGLSEKLDRLNALLSNTRTNNGQSVLDIAPGSLFNRKVEEIKNKCFEISTILGSGPREGPWTTELYHDETGYSTNELLPLAAYHLQQVELGNDVITHAKTALALLLFARNQRLIGGQRRRRQSRRHNS